MKSIYNVLFCAALLGMSSCEKELYKDPIGLLTPDQVNTEPTLNSVSSSVTSSYQMLSNTLNIIGNWDWSNGTVLRGDFILQDMASDDMQKKWNPDGDQAWMDEISNFRFTANNGGFNGVWSYDYEGIARANLAISYLTDKALTGKIGMDEATSNKLLGEAYFLRAFYYFDLVTNFGDVPLITKPLTNFSEAYDVAKRVPQAEVWDQISSDLANSVTLLPNSKYSDNAEKWRASKGAAIAMQAKVALFSEDWATVLAKVTELEGLNFYQLNENYFDNFSMDKEYSELEVIFSYNHESGKNPRNGNGINALLGWGFVAPTANFLAAFEPGDPRLSYTVDPQKQEIYKILGATNGNNKGNDDAASNTVFIRFADVLLWKAEALSKTGNQEEAIQIINEIRARARTTMNIQGQLPPAGTLPDRDITVTDPETVMNWIRQERRVELGFEGHRFRDLKRWKIARQVLTAVGKNFTDNNYLYPIPQGEIDKSGGTITQNVGY